MLDATSNSEGAPASFNTSGEDSASNPACAQTVAGDSVEVKQAGAVEGGRLIGEWLPAMSDAMSNLNSTEGAPSSFNTCCEDAPACAGKSSGKYGTIPAIMDASSNPTKVDGGNLKRDGNQSKSKHAISTPLHNKQTPLTKNSSSCKLPASPNENHHTPMNLQKRMSAIQQQIVAPFLPPMHPSPGSPKPPNTSSDWWICCCGNHLPPNRTRCGQCKKWRGGKHQKFNRRSRSDGCKSDDAPKLPAAEVNLTPRGSHAAAVLSPITNQTDEGSMSSTNTEDTTIEMIAQLVALDLNEKGDGGSSDEEGDGIFDCEDWNEAST